MTAAAGKLSGIVAGLLLVLTYLLIRSATPDPVLRERTLDAFHRVEIHDAELNQDVLRARAGLLPHYDSLVQAVRGLYEALATLQAGGEAAYGEMRADVDRQLSALAATVTGKEARVEAFKADNALLQNSLLYFNHAFQEPDARAGAGPQPLATELDALTAALFRFVRDPTRDAAGGLDRALDRLLRLPGLPGTRTLVTHGYLIVALLPKVDGVIGQLLAAPTIAQVRALREVYLDHHTQMETRARIFRLLLYLVAVALLAYLIYLFARLRQHAQALAERSGALQSRLTFESLVTEISTQFINLPPNEVDASIHHALATLGEYLAVDRAYLFLFSADRTHMDNTHEWCRAGIRAQFDRLKGLPMAELPWFVDNFERHGYLQVPRVTALPPEASAEKAHFEEQSIQSLLCVSMQCAGKRMGFLGFDAVRSEKSWANDDIALLRVVGEIFANALERKRAEAERETLEAQLWQSQKLESIGTLAGGIAHDFNNILGAILGYGEMALNALPEDSRPRYHVRQMMTAGQRAKAVVDQILTFSRSGNRERQPVELRALFEETLDLLRASLPATIEMQPRLAAENVTVLGDSTQLQQVLMNLCTNAAQAMQGRGRLEVVLETRALARPSTLSHGSLPAGSYARLRVGDTGPGMDESIRGRIFDPFFTTKEAGSGTGLGLSMVHGIVTDHGGVLDVRSEPGQGSTFDLYLPCASGCAAEAVETPGPLPPLPRGNGETILLVDDEQPLVALGEEMLAALGYEPVGFASSRQALASFLGDPQRFDLAITDEVMPEFTGTQLARRLHQLRPELPILLATGYSGPIRMEQARPMGIREILKKPLQLRDLAESIARHLRSNG